MAILLESGSTLLLESGDLLLLETRPVRTRRGGSTRSPLRGQKVKWVPPKVIRVGYDEISEDTALVSISARAAIDAKLAEFMQLPPLWDPLTPLPALPTSDDEMMLLLC